MRFPSGKCWMHCAMPHGTDRFDGTAQHILCTTKMVALGWFLMSAESWKYASFAVGKTPSSKMATLLAFHKLLMNIVRSVNRCTIRPNSLCVCVQCSLFGSCRQPNRIKFAIFVRENISLFTRQNNSTFYFYQPNRVLSAIDDGPNASLRLSQHHTHTLVYGSIVLVASKYLTYLGRIGSDRYRIMRERVNVCAVWSVMQYARGVRNCLQGVCPRPETPPIERILLSCQIACIPSHSYGGGNVQHTVYVVVYTAYRAFWDSWLAFTR